MSLAGNQNLNAKNKVQQQLYTALLHSALPPIVPITLLLSSHGRLILLLASSRHRWPMRIPWQGGVGLILGLYTKLMSEKIKNEWMTVPLLRSPVMAS